MTAPAPVLSLVALTGLVVGSYVVTAAMRFARRKPSSLGRSHCDHCGQTLSFQQTVPVLSYVAARGVCAQCRARIDPLHLAGEAGGLAVLLTAFMDGVTPRAFLLSVLGLALLAAAVVDLKVGRLPDVLTASVGAAAMALAALRSFQSLELGVVSSACAILVLLAVRWVATALGRDPGLGLGDVKLVGALALWLNISTPWMIVGAAVVGLLTVAVRRPAGRRIAFGPALGAAAWIVGLAGEWGHWPTTM